MVNHNNTAPPGYRLLVAGELLKKGDLVAWLVECCSSNKPDEFTEIPIWALDYPVVDGFSTYIRKIEDEW